MKLVKSLFALLVFLLPNSSAALFPVEEWLTIPVIRVDENSFEVIENDFAAGKHMWCAAGLYVEEYIPRYDGDIRVKTVWGPSASQPGRRSVVFTIGPVSNARKSYSTSVRREGLSLSAHHASSLCNDNFRVRLRVLRTE